MLCKTDIANKNVAYATINNLQYTIYLFTLIDMMLKYVLNNRMSDSDQDANVPPKTDVPKDSDVLLDLEYEEVYKEYVLPSNRSSVKLFIRGSVLKELVKRGISDDTTSLTKAVNDILEYAMASAQTELTNMSDVVAMEQALADRIEELTAANMGMTKLLYDISWIVEINGTYNSFREVAKSKIPLTQPKVSTPATPAKS
jgi:hypothetical protein